MKFCTINEIQLSLDGFRLDSYYKQRNGMTCVEINWTCGDAVSLSDSCAAHLVCSDVSEEQTTYTTRGKNLRGDPTCPEKRQPQYPENTTLECSLAPRTSINRPEIKLNDST